MTRVGVAGNHFKIRTPVEEGQAYLVKVEGTDGVYLLNIVLDKTAVRCLRGELIAVFPATESGPATTDCAANTLNAADTDNGPNEICKPESGESLETERFAFNIEESGALYLHTTGDIDTVGVLYGPDGSKIAEDDNSGDGNNFRIATNVDAGLHLLEVRGKTRTTEGTIRPYITNFVTGAEVDGPDADNRRLTPGTGPRPSGSGGP